jgi:glycogen synthase
MRWYNFFHIYQDLLVALTRAMETYKYPRVWEHLTWQAMRQTFSWELPAEKYLELYQRARSYHALV